jgi:hypothetical protein
MTGQALAVTPARPTAPAVAEALLAAVLQLVGDPARLTFADGRQNRPRWPSGRRGLLRGGTNPRAGSTPIHAPTVGQLAVPVATGA